MRSRNEIITDTTYDIKTESNLRLLLEVLLDIRDQNERIISHLNSMKKYSAYSNDLINVDKIWEKGDDKL